MKKILSIFAVAALLLSSCDKSGKDEPEVVDGSSVSLSEEALSAGPEGATLSVKVTSSEDWRVSGFCDWATVTPASGKSGQDLTVTVAPNPGDEARTVTFKVFAGDAVKALVVTSAPTFSIDLLSSEAVEVGPDAATVTVTLKSNIQNLTSDLGGASWLSAGESTEALGKKIFKFDVARSREFKAREGKITISGEGASVTVDVTQAQRDTVFAVEGRSVVKGLEAMDVTLNLRSNFDFKYQLDDWLTETSSSETDMDESGLKTKTISLHADATDGSRAQDIAFYKGSSMSVNYGAVYVKQQDPNPVFATIPDAALASLLQNQGWVLVDPVSGKSEVTTTGKTSTSLTVSSGSVKEISGIDAFPALANLSIGSSCRDLTKVDTGSSQVSALNFDNGHYFNIQELTLAGENIKSIVINCSGWYVAYGYDKLATLDVSGCPALETLAATRQYSSMEGPLRTIYMTQAQSESVTVTKNPSAQIVVK